MRVRSENNGISIIPTVANSGVGLQSIGKGGVMKRMAEYSVWSYGQITEGSSLERDFIFLMSGCIKGEMKIAFVTLLCLFAIGCRSTTEQEARILNGSFVPILRLEIEPEVLSAHWQDSIGVTLSLRNLSPYAVWVCRLKGSYLTLGGYLAPITTTSHPICEQRQVLKPQELMTWSNDLHLEKLACKEYKDLLLSASEVHRPVPSCYGDLQLQATVSLHLVPPGKYWPQTWVPVRLSAEYSSIKLLPSDVEIKNDAPVRAEGQWRNERQGQR